MPDIEVQRGTANIGNTGGTAAPGTNFGSTSSAFVRNLCNHRTSAGANGSTGNMEGDDISGALRITDVDEITFGRRAGSSTQAMRFAWESWEYTGPGGGANEFVVRGRYQLTMGSGTRTASTAVSGVVNEDDCVAFVTGIITDRTSDEADTLTALAWVDSSNNLQVQHGGRLAATVDVWVTVVEFTGSAWTVHHGRQENPGALTSDITLRTASDGLGGSTSSVSDWADAVIFHQYRSNLNNATDEAIADTSAVYGPGPSNGTVTWTHHSNFGDSASSPNRSTHMVQVLEHADLVVTRPAFDSQNAAGAMNVAVSGISDLDHSSVEVSRYSSGGGTAYGRGWVTAQLTSTSNVELWAHRSGNTIITILQVMDLTGIETVGGGSVSGDFAATIAAPTMGASGGVQGQASGGLAATVPASTMLASGFRQLQAVLGPTVPALELTAAGQRVLAGAMAAGVPTLVMDAAGTMQAVASGALAASVLAPFLAASGQTFTPIDGTLEADVPVPGLGSTGSIVRQGAVDATIPAAVLDASGLRQGLQTGAVAASIPVPLADFSGALQGVIAGALGATIPTPTMAADGDARALLSGGLDATIPAPLADFSGAAVFSGSIGSLAADIPAVELGADGVTTREGTFDATIPAPATGFGGTSAHLGGFAASIDAPELDAVGGRLSGGSFDAAIPGLTLQVVGQRVVEGAFGGAMLLLRLDAGGATSDTLPFVALVVADGQTTGTAAPMAVEDVRSAAAMVGTPQAMASAGTAAMGTTAASSRTVEPAPPTAPTPPTDYVAPTPTGAIVTTYAELAAEWALAGPRVIVVADGVYAGGGLQTTQGHHVWAQNRGQVTFEFGLGWRGNFGNAGGGVHGVAFSVDDVANVDPFALLNEAIVNTWDAVAPFEVGSGLVVEDCTFDGHGVIGSGIQAASPSGLTVRRCEFRRFIDVGISAFRNGSGPDDFETITIEDVVVEDVSRPVPGSGGGANAEHGLYLGHRFTLRRFLIRDCAWSGVAVINDANGWTIEDGDIDRVGFGVFESGSVGIYCEESHDGDIRRVAMGAEMKVGINCEWNRDDPDPWLNSLVPRNYDIRIDDVRTQAYKVGVHFDLSVSGCIVRQSRMERSWMAGVLDNNTFPDSNGDFPPPMGQDPRESTNVVDLATCSFLLEPTVPQVWNDQHGGAALLPTIPGWPLDPLLVDVGTLAEVSGGPLSSHQPGGVSDEVLVARTYDVAMGLPWYVNEEDEGSVLSELAVYPQTSDTLESPIDLSNVTDVELQYWDGSAWVDIAGIGSRTTEVLVATSTREAGTYHRLEFAPALGALQTVADTSGRGSHPRRWHLTISGGGDLHLPSVGYDTIHINERP